jgi:antitoxin component YwqK of YwqJK toxin-antitoxin module
MQNFESKFSVVAAALLATCSLAVAQQSTSQQAAAEVKRETVTIEPYTGPPIFLPRAEDPIPATKVEERTIIDYYDPETKEKPKTERLVARYSDDSLVNAGAYREFYEDGQVFVEGQYSEGNATGEWTYYHPNGEVAKKVNFVAGQPDGVVELFRADGTKEAIREFADGRRAGTWKTFGDSGEQQLTEEVYVDGKAEGVWQTWYDDGQQRQQIAFKAGKREGLSIEWDKDGIKRAEVNFKENKQDGMTRIWAADGTLVEQVYENGKLISTKRQ